MDRNCDEKIVMARPVLYDITRLVSRGLNKAPNGIDRIDFTLARYFLDEQSQQSQALIYTLLGPRLVPSHQAIKTINMIEDYWDNNSHEAIRQELDIVRERLISDHPTHKNRLRIKSRISLERLSVNLSSILNWALCRGERLQSAPYGSIYLNVSQFLLDKDWFVRDVLTRKDIKCVFYIHDLIATKHPEFFTKQEAHSFEKKIENISRHGDAFVTASQSVALGFSNYLANNQLDPFPSCIFRPNVLDAFKCSADAYNFDIDRPYYVMCGTIEPRKNHLLLLQLWRELSQSKDAPKLVLIGKRGWLYDEVVGMLERCVQIQPLVLEIEGLSTYALAQVLKGARALLAPSFTEGFGLPIIEAIAAEVPVIASDIDVFQEVGRGSLDYISPIDGNAWLAAIRDYAQENSLRRSEAALRIKKLSADIGKNNFTEVRDFIYAL